MPGVRVRDAAPPKRRYDVVRLWMEGDFRAGGYGFGMPDHREALRHELRSCIKRGLSLPRRPEPYELWEACGGNGLQALLVALEFEALRREAVERMMREARPRAA